MNFMTVAVIHAFDCSTANKGHAFNTNKCTIATSLVVAPNTSNTCTAMISYNAGEQNNKARFDYRASDSLGFPPLKDTKQLSLP